MPAAFAIRRDIEPRMLRRCFDSMSGEPMPGPERR
jgi:hypothetical protein